MSYLLYLLGVVIGGVIGFIFSLLPISEIIRLRRTPTFSINKLPSRGQVEIVGKAQGKNTTGLLTQRPCLIWQVKIEEHHGGGGHGSGDTWNPVYENTFTEPFELDDGSGRIQIFPSGAELELRDRLENDPFKISDEKIEEVVRSQNIDATGMFGVKKQFRAYEWIVEDNDEIYVLGVIKDNGATGKTIKASIISHSSEKELLGTLYLRVIGRFLGSIAIAVYLVYISIK